MKVTQVLFAAAAASQASAHLITRQAPLDEFGWLVDMTSKAQIDMLYVTEFFHSECMANPELRDAFNAAKRDEFSPESRPTLDRLTLQCFEQRNPVTPLCVGTTFPKQECSSRANTCFSLNKSMMNDAGFSMWHRFQVLRKCLRDTQDKHLVQLMCDTTDDGAACLKAAGRCAPRFPRDAHPASVFECAVCLKEKGLDSTECKFPRV